MRTSVPATTPRHLFMFGLPLSHVYAYAQNDFHKSHLTLPTSTATSV